MPELDERRTAERIDRIARDLLAGRRLRAETADAEDRRAIQAAAALAGSRQRSPGMSADFRRRLSARLDGRPEPRTITRRAALLAGAGVALGAVAGAALERAVQAGRTAEAPALDTAAATVVAPDPSLGRWWDTGIVATDLADGVPRAVTAGSIRAFVVRRGATVGAVSGVCTHLPCDLRWESGAGVLNCPCHNQSFDVSGRSMSRPYALPPLPAVRVRVRAGRVEVLGTT